jgi:hypothetical protein
MDDFFGDVVGGLFEGIIDLFGGLIAEIIAPLFQLWFSSVWSFLTGSGILGALGYGLFLLLH